MKTVVRLELMRHRDADQVSIRYNAAPDIDKVVRALPGRKWSQTQGTWYVAADASTIKEIYSRLEGRATIDSSAMQESVSAGPPSVICSPISEGNREVIGAFKVWMESKRYSPNTICC